MNGSGRAITKRFQSVAENNRRSLYLAFIGDLTAALQGAAGTYIDFLASRERQRVAERALALAETIHRSTQQRIEVGTMAPSDLITAELQVATARRDVVRRGSGGRRQCESGECTREAEQPSCH